MAPTRSGQSATSLQDAAPLSFEEAPEAGAMTQTLLVSQSIVQINLATPCVAI